MATEAPRESLQAVLDAAIRAAFAAEQDDDSRAGIVVDWALSCEIAAADGEMYVHSIRAPGSLTWRAIGLLTVHLDSVRDILRGVADE